MSPLWRRILAIVAGFIAVALLSTGMDARMNVTGVFPAEPVAMSAALFAFAALYRALFTVAGGAITTKLSGDGSYRPAQILSLVGLLGGLAGVAAWFSTPDLGPLWYALTIPVSAVPCTLLGAWLVLGQRQT